MIKAQLQHWRNALRRRRTCRLLLSLDDRMLADIGQNRADLEQEFARPLLRLHDRRRAKYPTAPYHQRLN